MSRIFAPLIVEYINNSNYVQLHERFGFQSDVLKDHGLKDEIWAEAGFVFDFESIPNIIRGPIGENKRGGSAHDILSRKNVCPGITQGIAADVYAEIMDYCDAIDRAIAMKDAEAIDKVKAPFVNLGKWLRRVTKSTVVRYWPGGFWQKHELTATIKEITGLEGDPYLTIEKLNAAIEQSEQATAEIKAVPAQVEQKADLVEASEQVTAELKDAKAEVVAKVVAP